VSVGEGKLPVQELPQLLENAGLPTLLGSFGLFESSPACAALLRWAGLREVQTVDYHALRERDIERLADLVEQHLDTARLRELCGV
jgi:adenosylcobyric acid synthase